MKYEFIAIILCASSAMAVIEPALLETAQYRQEGSDYSFYRCELLLDGDMFWDVAQIEGAERFYLVPPTSEDILPQGKRMRTVMRDKHIQRGRNPLSQHVRISKKHAQANGGIGPATLDDVDQNKFKSQIRYATNSPWAGMADLDVSPPYAFLLPNVRYTFSGPRTNRVAREDRKLQAVELTPFVDDGKHWVVYTDGLAERVDIDPELLKKYSLDIRPVMSLEEASTPQAKNKPHILLAARKAGDNKPLRVSLRNSLSGETRSIDWNISSTPVSPTVTNDIRLAREAAWWPYKARSSGPVITSWGTEIPSRNARRNQQREPSPSAFGVMGGRAAVRETLQMQALRGAASKLEDRTIPITNLQGVTVHSHPFEKMLSGNPGGQLELACVVPPDQFMLYVGKPSAILPLLEEGAEFLSGMGSVVANNSIKYALSDRYLSRLGMDTPWLQKLLNSGAVQEMAIVTPDLFFIDGTDISVVSRLAKPRLMKALLKLIGVSGLSPDKLVTTQSEKGDLVYWAIRDDLLFAGTHPKALKSMLNLHANAGENSLGKSAEFRYMLTQLPVNDTTRIYAYLSDPFIRHLVGPQAKISQLRRITARSEMEFITAQAILARLDGRPAPTIDSLIRDKYIPKHFADGGYVLDKNLVIHSESYGTLANMATFSELPATAVSKEEEQHYKRYVDNYTRFWRQFFDPIAIRLDETADQSLELTTYILPLVDNSIYNGLREVLHTREDDRPLNTPVISPKPIFKISLNLREKAWVDISKNFHEIFESFANIDSAVMDDLGPGFHLAVHDADPIITLGSGDIFGAFGGNTSRRNNEMLAIPMFLSVLTRPCTMIIETKDPVKTKRFLSEAASMKRTAPRRSGWMGTSLHQVSGRDEWVLTLDIENVIKLRYGMEVDGSHVLIRNIPWSSLDRLESVEVSELNSARIDAYPGACALQLPGLHASATDGARASAADSMGHIYPLLISGVSTLDNVEQVHKNLFGFYPVHPGSGKWIWNGSELSSTAFGSARRQHAPPYDKDDPTFGALKGIDSLSMSMQFEDTGLRSKIRWKLK